MYKYPDVTPVLSRLSASVSEFQNECRVTGLCTHDNNLPESLGSYVTFCSKIHVTYRSCPLLARLKDSTVARHIFCKKVALG